MASQNQDFIKIPVAEGVVQTMPVDEAKRLAASEIKIELAEEKDAYEIVPRQNSASLHPSTLTSQPGPKRLRQLPRILV